MFPEKKNKSTQIAFTRFKRKPLAQKTDMHLKKSFAFHSSRTNLNKLFVLFPKATCSRRSCGMFELMQSKPVRRLFK